MYAIQVIYNNSFNAFSMFNVTVIVYTWSYMHITLSHITKLYNWSYMHIALSYMHVTQVIYI